MLLSKPAPNPQLSALAPAGQKRTKGGGTGEKESRVVIGQADYGRGRKQRSIKGEKGTEPGFLLVLVGGIIGHTLFMAGVEEEEGGDGEEAKGEE
jgi:hypothetical protein